MNSLAIIIALRGVLELALWLLLGRCLLSLLAGRSESENAVIKIFDYLLRPVRACANGCFPGLVPGWRNALTGLAIGLVWLMLGGIKLALLEP